MGIPEDSLDNCNEFKFFCEASKIQDSSHKEPSYRVRRRTVHS